MPTGKPLDPKLAEKIMLKAGLKPLEPYKKGNAKWKCIHLQCGRIVHTSYSSIKKPDGTYRTGCKPCGALKNKIPADKAIAQMEKAGLTPLEPYKNASSPWKCKCRNCGSIVSPSYTNIRLGKSCKICSRSQTLVNPKKIAIVMKKRKLQPLEPYTNNRTRWKCKCLRCGKIVYPRFSGIQNLSKNSTGCLDCGRKQYAKSNSTPNKVAIDVMLKAKLKPLEPYKNSGSPWKCKCLVCNKTLTTSYTSVAYHKSGCRYCNNIKKELKNKRKDFLKIAKKARLKPLEPYKSIHTPWKCKCLVCKNIVTPSLNSLQKGQGCKFCAVRGINLTVPSYIYLITNDFFYSHKIGIGNKKSSYTDRLTKFNSKGWKTHKVWNFATGEEAWKIEQAIFKVIRKDLKIPSHLSIEQMGKQLGGQTETVNADSITLLELEKIIKKVIKDYKEK
jgi:hypothetical protein